MKRFQLAPITGLAGKVLQVPDEENAGKQHDATLKDMLRVMVFSLPAGKLTMQDCIHSEELMGQINKADGYLEIGEGLHDWLKRIADENAPAIFGINAVLVHNGLDGFERPNVKQEQKDK